MVKRNSEKLLLTAALAKRNETLSTKHTTEQQRTTHQWRCSCWNFIVFPTYISWSLSYISILGLGFGSTCYRLTLLQLEHVSRHFIHYLGIIYEISLCVFLSGVRDFTVVMQGLLTYLCTLLGHNISNHLLIIASHHLRFTHIIWAFLGRISGSNTVRTFVSYYVSLYISTLILGCRAPV